MRNEECHPDGIFHFSLLTFHYYFQRFYNIDIEEGGEGGTEDGTKDIDPESTEGGVGHGGTTPSHQPSYETRTEITSGIESCLRERGDETNAHRHGETDEEGLDGTVGLAYVGIFSERKDEKYHEEGAKGFGCYCQRHGDDRHGGITRIRVELPKHAGCIDGGRCATHDGMQSLVVHDGGVEQKIKCEACQDGSHELRHDIDRQFAHLHSAGKHHGDADGRIEMGSTKKTCEVDGKGDAQSPHDGNLENADVFAKQNGYGYGTATEKRKNECA